MSARAWRHRIGDMVQAIERIEAYAGNMDFQAFASDSRTIDAVIRNFIIIGEAARRIPPEVAARHAEIPWRLMADMQNFAVHEYWGVNANTVWETIQNELPPLVPRLRSALAAEEGAS